MEQATAFQPYGRRTSSKATTALKRAKKRASDEGPENQQAATERFTIGEVPVDGHFVDDGSSPRYGICLSGGGIRSASFCLGVLQEMRRTTCQGKDGKINFLTSARFLSAVSGGGYMAGAHVMVNRGEFPGEQDHPDKSDPKRGPMVAEPPSLDMPAFAPESPEERYLRDRTRYLSHGWGGPLGVVWRMVAGIAWNIVILALGIGLIAVPIGWIYGAAIPSLRAGCVQGCAPHHLSPAPWVFVVPAVLAAAALAVAMLWVAVSWRKEGMRKALLGISLGLLGGGLAWLLFAVGIPWLLVWIQTSGAAHSTQSVASAGGTTGTVAALSGAGTGASILTAIFGLRAVRVGQAAWRELSPSQQKGVTGYIAKQRRALWAKIKMPLLNFLASLIGPITMALIAILWIHIGSLYQTALFIGLWAVGAVVLGVIWVFADMTAWSMHPFYRERLSAAFSLKRFRALPDVWSPTVTDDGPRLVDATRRPYDFLYSLSEATNYGSAGTAYERSQAGRPLPERRIGDVERRHGSPDPSVAIGWQGPEDRRVGVQDRRLTFPELILCGAANVSKYGTAPTNSRVSSFVFSANDVGGPLLGSWPAKVYEDALEGLPRLKRNLTLPAAVAICGAAVSPEMGRMTRAPLRFLLTIMNVRLGVWMPNPNRLPEFKMRRNSFWGKIRMLPRVTYLLREMVGKNDPEANFIYVTDGGHYENLGLVELLRRKCRYIWCIDASGERQDGFSTIAGAIALAYNELGCRIDIDPAAEMAPDPTITKQRADLGLRPVVKRTFSVGTVYYDPKDLTDIARLAIVKTGIPADAPQDVAAFYESDNKAFPCDPTLDQLYTADRFDAYRSLGAFAANRAIQSCKKDFQFFLAHGHASPTIL